MEIRPTPPGDRQVIDGYGSGGFRLSKVRHEGSLLVLPTEVLTWPVSSFEALDAAALEPVVARSDKIDVLLVGTGPRFQPLGPELRRVLTEHGVVPEVMDTGAACRTYNVLMLEGRLVAAALIAV